MRRIKFGTQEESRYLKTGEGIACLWSDVDVGNGKTGTRYICDKLEGNASDVLDDMMDNDPYSAVEVMLGLDRKRIFTLNDPDSVVIHSENTRQTKIGDTVLITFPDDNSGKKLKCTIGSIWDKSDERAFIGC